MNEETPQLKMKVGSEEDLDKVRYYIRHKGEYKNGN